MRLALSLTLLLFLPSVAVAQFDNRWLELDRSGGSLALAPLDVCGTDAEVDFSWGDLDGDGLDDLVAVRKEPFGTPGKRANLLLLNEGGVLRDRTATHAAASDVPLDLGFLTPTADRDVVLADVDLDGRLDVVTATTLGAGEPKAVSHPRVYRNLGSSGGAWQGLLHEDARIPELLHATSGLPAPPRFTSVAGGDLDADGSPDLYFGDGDEGPGGLAPAAEDLDDRLLLNDGSGYFSDASALALPAFALFSFMCPEVAIADVNGDGRNDVVKDEGYAVTELAVLYNDPGSPGTFSSFQIAAAQRPYGFALGDLNNDGRLDAVLADNAEDFYLYNLGTDPAGQVTWSAPRTFSFLAGADDGIATNTRIADLDGDGWRDVIICDVGVTFVGFDRRVHIYHNPGGAAGAELTLVEEREDAAEPATGWLGAVGLHAQDLAAGFDSAVFDVEGDGDADLLLGRSAGLDVWVNQTVRNALIADVADVSLSAGGTQGWTLNAGTDRAGDFYLILGTFSGTSPGLPLGGVTIPLNVDPWFNYTLNKPGQAPLAGTLGFLDADGKGGASLTLPPGTNPALAGFVFHHSLVTFDGVTFAIASASQPVSLGLVP